MRWRRQLWRMQRLWRGSRSAGAVRATLRLSMLPPAPFTVPTGSDALGPYRTRHLFALARRTLDWPFPLPPHLAQDYARVRGQLAETMRQDRVGFLAALALPTIGGALGGGDLATAMPQLLLELARRNILDERGIFWGAPVARLVSPFLGVSRVYGRPKVGMLFQSGRVTESPTDEWVLAETTPDGSFVALEHGGWLCMADTNPLAMQEAHPGKSGNKLDLGDTDIDSWVKCINDARARTALYGPQLAGEHSGILAGIVPVGTDADVSLSASYREAIGVAYLSLHPSSLTMTEAIVHETQHSKANLLSWSDPLVTNSGESYPSPVRPDPRPLWGVLLAVHAFLPVALIHRGMCQAGDPLYEPQRHREVLAINHDGMQIIRAHAKPTALGRVVIDGMDALEAALWSEQA